MFVTGYSRGPPPRADYATVAYNAAPAPSCGSRATPAPATARRQAPRWPSAPPGRRCTSPGTATGCGLRGRDYATVAYSAATGARLWVRATTAPARVRSPLDRCQPATGTVFVTGFSVGVDVTMPRSPIAADFQPRAPARRVTAPAATRRAGPVPVDPDEEPRESDKASRASRPAYRADRPAEEGRPCDLALAWKGCGTATADSLARVSRQTILTVRLAGPGHAEQDDLDAAICTGLATDSPRTTSCPGRQPAFLTSKKHTGRLFAVDRLRRCST